MIVDRVQVSLMSQHRLVVLRDIEEERYLPIWIGQFESEAITLELQGMVSRTAADPRFASSPPYKRWAGRFVIYSSIV